MPWLVLIPWLILVPGDGSFTLVTPEAAPRSAEFGPPTDIGLFRLTDGSTVDPAHLLRIERAGLPVPLPTSAPLILLATGDRLSLAPGSLLLKDEQAIYDAPRWRSPTGKPLVFPQAGLDVVCWVRPPGADQGLDPFLAELRRTRRSRDLVLLRNGDRLEGTVLALDSKQGCQVEVGQRKLDLVVSQLAMIVFQSEFQSRPRTRKLHALAVLTTGESLLLQNFSVDGVRNRFSGKTLYGPTVEGDLSQLALAHFRQGRAIYLSDLTPKSVEHVPFLGVSWPMALDTGLAGQPLQLAGSWYPKGLAMQSRTRVTYALDGQYQLFETVLGMNPLADPRARVRLQVLLDGKEMLPKKEWSPQQAPEKIRIELGQARELILLTDFGSWGNVQSRAFWGDARLITKKE